MMFSNFDIYNCRNELNRYIVYIIQEMTKLHNTIKLVLGEILTITFGSL